MEMIAGRIGGERLVRLLEPRDRFFKSPGAVVGGAHDMKVPGRPLIPERGFRPFHDLLRLNARIGGLYAATSQDVRHEGIAGLAFAPSHRLHERPKARLVADEQPEARVLEPLFAVGWRRRDSPREIGSGKIPAAPQGVVRPRTHQSCPSSGRSWMSRANTRSHLASSRILRLRGVSQLRPSGKRSTRVQSRPRLRPSAPVTPRARRASPRVTGRNSSARR